MGHCYASQPPSSEAKPNSYLARWLLWRLQRPDAEWQFQTPRQLRKVRREGDLACDLGRAREVFAEPVLLHLAQPDLQRVRYAIPVLPLVSHTSLQFQHGAQRGYLRPLPENGCVERA
jgi:hypothetical protein